MNECANAELITEENHWMKSCSICGKRPRGDGDGAIWYTPPGLTKLEGYVYCGQCLARLAKIRERWGSGTKYQKSFAPPKGAFYTVGITQDMKSITISSAHPLLMIAPQDMADAIRVVMGRIEGKDAFVREGFWEALGKLLAEKREKQ